MVGLKILFLKKKTCLRNHNFLEEVVSYLKLNLFSRRMVYAQYYVSYARVLWSNLWDHGNNPWSWMCLLGKLMNFWVLSACQWWWTTPSVTSFSGLRFHLSSCTVLSLSLIAWPNMCLSSVHMPYYLKLFSSLINLRAMWWRVFSSFKRLILNGKFPYLETF